MILDFSIQNLALLFLLRQRLLPTRIRQQCRSTCVGFIPMVLSPIGPRRFRYETLRLLLRNTGELDFSKSMKRSHTRIWDPGENGSDYKVFWIEHRSWPNFTYFVFDEEELGRWPLNFLVWVLVYIGSRVVFNGVISDLTTRVKFNPNNHYKIQNRLNLRCIHIVYRRLLGFDQYLILLAILSSSEASDLSMRCALWSLNKEMFFTHTFHISGRTKREKEIVNSSDSTEKRTMDIIEHQWVGRYRRHDSESFQATCQSTCSIKVMQKAFRSFIYKMIACYKCMKRGLDRFILLPVRLLLESRVTSTSSSKLGFNFLYLFQRLYLNGFLYHVSCKPFMK